MVLKCRSRLNEPLGQNDPQRTDAELFDFLDAAVADYVSKVPGDAFPELVTTATFTGTYWSIPTDYIKLLQVRVNHLVVADDLTTESVTETAQIVEVDGEYIADHFPDTLGAYAIFDTARIKVGPNAVTSYAKYLSSPGKYADCEESGLRPEHDEPIVNFACALAALKIDDDAAPFMALYDKRVQAEQVRYGAALDIERVP
jgi:hypothetical protein